MHVRLALYIKNAPPGSLLHKMDLIHACRIFYIFQLIKLPKYWYILAITTNLIRFSSLWQWHHYYLPESQQELNHVCGNNLLCWNLLKNATFWHSFSEIDYWSMRKWGIESILYYIYTAMCADIIVLYFLYI